ncbi:hypothetical protein RN001_005927 [Aquatica leii]|uniref:MADF domain-containing protein n=1 Tax=Aquatica leii TaxID=1421715 RepID=A0AAN7PDD1_9COLE|nr:hypothetical protein RN001_005927 [Aquatica leii]
MSWSHEQVTTLIDLYREKPCLYVVKSPIYKNKHARQAAWEFICRSLTQLRPATTISEIKNKINGLRTNFISEYRKWQKSKCSGVGDDDVYVPTLWYYNDIMFIRDHMLPRASIDNMPDEIIDDTPALPVDEHNYYDIQPESGTLTEISSASSSKSDYVSVSSKKKRRCEKAELDIIESATNTLKTISSTLAEKKFATEPVVKDHIQIFTEFVGSRIRLLNEDSQTEVMEKITQILFNSYKNE